MKDERKSYKKGIKYLNLMKKKHETMKNKNKIFDKNVNSINISDIEKYELLKISLNYAESNITRDEIIIKHNNQDNLINEKKILVDKYIDSIKAKLDFLGNTEE